MSYTHIHQSIFKALEEGRHAYSTMLEAGETPNLDYAGYCSHVALGRLRKALNNPHISAERLEGMLRRVAHKYACDHPESRWSDVTARYLRRHVNGNLAQGFSS